jgi:Spy/CpxP family protein refolding chaperone
MIRGGQTVNKTAKILVISMLSLALIPLGASSQDSDEGVAPDKRPEMTNEERRAAWDNLSDEEKQARREQVRSRREEMRAKWESMTPEEREAKRAERQKRMESMTPEQREAMQQRRQQRGQSGGKRQGGKKNQGS